MLTDSEKQEIEAQVRSQLEEEKHARELRDYKDALLAKERKIDQEDKGKGNDSLPGTKVAITICGILFCICLVYLFALWAMNREYGKWENCFECIGLVWVIQLIRLLWLGAGGSKGLLRRKLSVRILSAAFFAESVLFSLLGGYLHCPHEYAHALYNRGVDTQVEEVNKRNCPKKPVELCESAYGNAAISGSDFYWIDHDFYSSREKFSCLNYYDIRDVLQWMPALGFAFCIFGWIVAYQIDR